MLRKFNHEWNNPLIDKGWWISIKPQDRLACLLKRGDCNIEE